MAPEQFVIKNNEALLNLPEGLTFVNGFNEKQTIEDIKGGQSRYAKWIVRGDVPGSYEFTADFNGTLIPFEAPINATFKTGDPLVVSDLSEDLEIHVHPTGKVVPGKAYTTEFQVRNYSDSPRHNVTLKIGNLEDRPENNKILVKDPETGKLTVLPEGERHYYIESNDYGTSIPVMQEGDKVTIKTLNPEEKLSIKYMTIFPGDAEQKDCIYILKEMFSNVMPENTIDIPVHIHFNCDVTKGINSDTKPCDDPGVDTNGQLTEQIGALSLMGENDVPYSLKYNSNLMAHTIENNKVKASTFSDITEPIGDYGKGGWFSNIDVSIKANNDNSLNLHYTPTDSIPFTKSQTEEDFSVIGNIKSDGLIQVEKNVPFGNYTTDIPGYENHVITMNEDKSFILKNSSPYSYYFSEDGILLKIIDKDNAETSFSEINEYNQKIIETSSGKKETITYDDFNRVVELENDMGERSTLSYNSDGQLESIIDYKGNINNFVYDNLNRIIGKTTEEKNFTYKYDDDHRVIEKTDGMGYTSTYTYEETELGELSITVTNKNGFTSKTMSTIHGQVQSREDALGNTKRYIYDERGNIIFIVDKNGYSTKYDYDDKNQQIAFTDEIGNKETMFYDENGNKIKTVYPDGTQETSIYDVNNNLLTSTSRNGIITAYTYDEKGRILTSTIDGAKSTYIYSGDNLIEYVDSNGNIETYTYDASNNKVSETSKNGTITYIYDSNNNLIEVKDYDGLITKYEYDLRGNTIKTIYSNGDIYTQEYDLKNRVIKAIDTDGTVTNYEYDSKGNLTKTSNSKGNVSIKTYNLNNLIISSSYNGDATTYEYDKLGKLLKTTYSDGTTTTTVYDQVGNVTEEKDRKDKITKYTYDSKGNVLTTTLPNGGVITNTYHPTGTIASETDELGNITKYFYNNMYQVERVENAKGNSTHYTYDINENVTSITDSKGNSEFWTYDKRGNILSVTDKKGNITNYEYDKNNNLTKITDALNNENKMYYDENNQLTKTINAKGATTEYKYNENGDIFYIKNPIGEVVTCVYDEDGKLIQVKNTLGVAIENYEYDQDNRITKLTDENGNIIESYEYDENGNLTKTTDAFGNISESIYSEKYGYVVKTINELNDETSYEYDANGNLIKVINAEGGNVAYEYNENRDVTKITDELGNTSTFNYNILGDLTNENLSSGITKTYNYDSLNLLKEVINGRGQSINYNYDKTDLLTEVDGTIFTYDANGNVLTATNQEGTTKRTYDALDRVTSFTDVNGNKIGYTYDKVSNLKSITYPAGEVVTYSYNLIDQLIKVTDYAGRETQYSYDDRGRLIETKLSNGNLETNSYNILGQLIEVILTIDNIEYTISYGYDSVGKMISETLINITNDANQSLTNSLTINASMNYLDGNILGEHSGKKVITDKDGNITKGLLNNAVTDFTYDNLNTLIKAGNTNYFYDGEGTRIKQVSGTKEYSYVTDTISYLSKLLLKGNPDGTETIYVYGNGLISQETKTSENNKIVYKNYATFHYDYRGSTIALTNETGQITDTYSYGPYGELLLHKGKTENIFKYVGKYGVQTDSNNLVYMRNRYYNLDMKRF